MARLRVTVRLTTTPPNSVAMVVEGTAAAATKTPQVPSGPCLVEAADDTQLTLSTNEIPPVVVVPTRRVSLRTTPTLLHSPMNGHALPEIA